MKKFTPEWLRTAAAAAEHETEHVAASRPPGLAPKPPPRFEGFTFAWSDMRGFDLGLEVVRWKRLWWRFYRVELTHDTSDFSTATHWKIVFFSRGALEEFFEGFTK